MAGDRRREEWLPTRSTLLRRIRNPEDADGWQEFYDTYRRLVSAIARRRGLSVSEAEDATQDTVIAVLRTMSRFHYDPRRCSFKSWLSRLADQRITDFLRRRPVSVSARRRADSATTSSGDLAADPASLDPDAVWEAEWRQDVMSLALQRLERTVKPLSYQAFYLHSLKGQSPRQVARSLGLSLARL